MTQGQRRLFMSPTDFLWSFDEKELYGGGNSASAELKKGGAGRFEGKGKKGIQNELPSFDLKRASPGKTVTTWQTAISHLECGEAPTGHICICEILHRCFTSLNWLKLEKYSRPLPWWLDTQMAIRSLRTALWRCCHSGKSCFEEGLCGACLDASKPQITFAQPSKVELKAGLRTQPMTSLRINIALNFVESKTKGVCLEYPSMALHYTGAKQFRSEAKTSNSTCGNCGILTGYVLVPTDKVAHIMKLGSEGSSFRGWPVMARRLRSTGWSPDYLARALDKAKSLNSCLTFRGGVVVTSCCIRWGCGNYREWLLGMGLLSGCDAERIGVGSIRASQSTCKQKQAVDLLWQALWVSQYCGDLISYRVHRFGGFSFQWATQGWGEMPKECSFEQSLAPLLGMLDWSCSSFRFAVQAVPWPRAGFDLAICHTLKLWAAALVACHAEASKKLAQRN